MAEVRETKIRKTKINSAIDEVLGKSDKPLTVAEIILLLKNDNLEPNKTTVYRQVEKMADEGLIERVHLDGKALGYEKSDSHHHHLICKSCDNIEDIVIEGEEEMLKKVVKRNKFRADEHHLEIFGLCASCTK